MNRLHILAVMFLLTPWTSAASATARIPAAPSPVTVTVQRRAGPGQVNYHFSVRNGSPRLVTGLRIGWDAEKNRPELRTAPMGWDAGQGPPSSTVSPKGWRCTVVPQSSDLFHLVWRPESDSELPPGNADFSVALKDEDPTYERAHWTVFAEGRTYSGTLRTMKNSGEIIGLSARDSLEQKVLDYVLHPTIDSPDHRPATFGPSARPALLAMLDDSDFDHHRSQIFVLLGFVGDARDTPVLESFVLEKPKGEIDDWQLGAIFGALGGLGRLSTRDPKAMEFMRQATNPDFFRRIPYVRRFQEQSRLRLLLSQITINALAWSENPDAGRLLAELQQHPYDPSQMGNIKEAIAHHRRVVEGR